MRTIGKGRSSAARALMSTIGATGSVKLVADAGVGSGVGSSFGLGDGAGVGVGAGVGGVTGATTTISVVTDQSLSVSTGFFTVILTPSRKPRSALVTTYFSAVAPSIWAHEAPVALHRRHWWTLTVGLGTPD